MPIHVLDTNVLVEAHKGYYAFDICPGYWECLEHHALANRIVSVDKVLDEIRQGKDRLKTWAVRRVLKPFFAATDAPAVTDAYRELMRGVNAQPQLMDAAKAEFARGADGWIIAYAKAHGLTVVTLELPNPQSRKRVLMPDVCRAAGVPFENTFEMLRALGSRFEWTP